MLLYRPLLTVYRETPFPPVRRFLLREFSQPRLHAEPEEILDDLAHVREVSIVQVAERLAAEVALRERMLRLRLTTGDTARQTGGIWTYHAQHRAVISWAKQGTPGPALVRAAGSWLGPVALGLMRRTSGAARAEVLAALGDLGEDIAAVPLTEELVEGAMPEAAAVGIARMGGPAATLALESAVKRRGMARSAAFLGVALRALPLAGADLLGRMFTASESEVREAGAWALGNQHPKRVQHLVNHLKTERDSFVRLNLLASLARLRLQGSLEIVRTFYLADETELVRTAAIRAAGALVDAGAPEFLQYVLANGTPAERAEALQALVTLQVAPEPYLDEARRAASSSSGRLKLLGLLALVVWAPEEAFDRVKKIVSGQPTDEWFIATYALRYLEDSSAVRLLKRICEASRNSELEEIAVDALSRHLERSGVVEFLLNTASDARPVIVERIMQEFARHLPAEDAMATSVVLRQQLDAKPGPAIAGPLLVALGSLGGPDDAARALPHLQGEAQAFAVRALELLMADSALPHLEALAHRTDEPASAQAVTALMRLGHPGAAEELLKFTHAKDGLVRGAISMLDCSLSVRHVRSIRRLALLHGALQDRSKVLPEGPVLVPLEEDEDADHAESGLNIHMGHRPGSMDLPVARTRPDFLERIDRTKSSASADPIPKLAQVPAGPVSARVYQELGAHMHGKRRAASPAGARMLAAAVVILTLSAVGAWYYLRGINGN